MGSLFRRKSSWVIEPDLDDSVLLWRAAKAIVPRQSASSTLIEILRRAPGAMGGMGLGSGGHAFTGGPASNGLIHAQQIALTQPRATGVTPHEAAYQLACLELTPRLTPFERAALRRYGRLPPWFPQALATRADEIARQHKQLTQF